MVCLVTSGIEAEWRCGEGEPSAFSGSMWARAGAGMWVMALWAERCLRADETLLTRLGGEGVAGFGERG